MTNNNLNIMELRAIPALLNKSYYIPEYQRGYRWGEKQVLALLNDLDSFFNGDLQGDFYCLQPIVVKSKTIDDEHWYEVIDGQQRLTTLRILLQVMEQMFPTSRSTYTIRYATRPQLQGIFDTITLDSAPIGSKKMAPLKPEWAGYIDAQYIWKAAQTILDWFNANSTRFFTFVQNLFNAPTDPSRQPRKSVQVVWYETCEPRDAHYIFNRMNSLKVGLSNSELIRSLFLSSTTRFALDIPDNLSDSVKSELSRERLLHRQISINEKWDEIEQYMSQKDFQAFLTNRHDTGRNSIGLLFDLMSRRYATGQYFDLGGKEIHKDDEQYTYLYFKDLLDRETEDAYNVWETILRNFEKLRRWYADRDLYHHIGYLNAVAGDRYPDEAICNLLDVRDGNSALRRRAREMVRKTVVKPEGVGDYDQLDYNNKAHYDYLKRLLLLHNVESFRCSRTGEMFPFHRHRYNSDGVPRRWTLEHIHAQNSDCLPENNREEWLAWMRCNLEALKTLNIGDPAKQHTLEQVIEGLEKDITLSENDSAYWKRKYTFQDIKSRFEDVTRFYSMLEDDDRLPDAEHQLSNLALLEQPQNSQINNSPFEVKRRYISSLVSDGEYVPLCTRKAFLKLYDREHMQVHTWGQGDRASYYKDIIEKLTPYLI